MSNIPASILTLLAGILITLISVWVGQHHGLLPEQASMQAPLVDGFFDVMATIGTALFLLVQGAILYFVIRYRRRGDEPGDGVPIEGSLPLEILWTSIPAVIVIGLGIYSVSVYEQMGGLEPGSPHHHESLFARARQTVVQLVSFGDETPAAADSPRFGIGASPETEGKMPDLTVNVKGLQYAWLFDYPDQGGLTTGELHVPVGKDVQLNITALDVIHSFWVPQFRLKQDALPGQQSELRFVATKVGTYPVVCTELCGAYHGSMRTNVVVHTASDFEQWLSENQIAQQENPEPQRVVATRPADMSDRDFLAPYAERFDLDQAALADLQPRS